MISDIEESGQVPLIRKSKVQEKGHSDNADKFNCGICYEDYDPGEVELKMLDNCNHTFCADCF